MARAPKPAPTAEVHVPQEILDASARISFNSPLGQKIDYFTPISGIKVPQTVIKTSVPGVYTLWLAPMVGGNTDAASPINVAKRGFSSFVRHANSGAKWYVGADLMMTQLAVAEVMSFHAFMQRAFGVFKLISSRNRYFPETLFAAMNLDYTDFAQHESDFWFYINQFARRSGALYLINNFGYVNEKVATFSKIYTDEPTNAKAQVYMYNPAGFFQYQAYTDEKGGKLAFKMFRNANHLYTFDELVEFGESLLAPLVNDDDIGFMLGDISKAFGEDNGYKREYIKSDYLITPEFNLEALSVMRNTTVYNGIVTANGAWDITQVNDTIVHHPMALIDVRTMGATRLIASDIDNPTPADVYRYTKYCTMDSKPSPATSGGKFVNYIDVGALFVCESAWAYVREGDSSDYTKHFVATYTRYPTVYNTPQLSIQTAIDMCYSNFIFSQFEYAPLRYASVTNTSVDPYEEHIVPLDGNYNNYTIIDQNVLRKIHEGAMMGYFRVPLMGMWE